MVSPAKEKFIIILLAVATIGVEAVQEIPEFLHICQVREPQYDACIINSINNLKPYLKSGVPEYRIPSLEPLKLKKLTFSVSNSMRLAATDVLAYDVSNFKTNNVKADLNTLNFMVDVELPNIRVEGKYEIDGKVLLLPIRGSGPMSGNFSDCKGVCKIKAEKYIDEDGMEKIRVTDFKLKITVGKGSLKLNNLFDGERVLGDVINTAINNNFDLFIREIIPYVEKGLSDAFQNIADNIVQQFSFAQLFPGA